MDEKKITDNQEGGDRIGQLLIGRLETPSGDETIPTELVEWMKENPEGQSVYDELRNEEHVRAEVAMFDAFQSNMENALKKIQASREPTKSGTEFRVPRVNRQFLVYIVGIAATVIMAIAGYFILYPRYAERTADNIPIAAKQDIGPGKDHAILRLAGGQQIVLDITKDR